MKSVVFALLLFATGMAAGFFVRMAFAEDKTQRNLAALSGESLSQLDVVARFTRGFSPEEIERRWEEHAAFTKTSADINLLKEAWQSWERAIIYQQVERVGWSDYRNVIIHNSGRYLDSQRLRDNAPASDFAKAEAKRAADMIHEAIPAELLAKSGPFH